jgi:hypothetical protein
LNPSCKVCTKNYRSTHAAQKLFYAAKTRAKIKGLTFTINKEDVIVPDICPVLGILLVTDNDKNSPNSPSLDRIDNNLGYTPENICVISNRANKLKNDATIEELELILKYMKRMRKKQLKQVA